MEWCGKLGGEKKGLKREMDQKKGKGVINKGEWRKNGKGEDGRR